jgi:hypothetical protein
MLHFGRGLLTDERATHRATANDQCIAGFYLLFLQGIILTGEYYRYISACIIIYIDCMMNDEQRSRE